MTLTKDPSHFCVFVVLCCMVLRRDSELKCINFASFQIVFSFSMWRILTYFQILDCVFK